MSKQEMKGADTSVVLVEQTTSSRHKWPVDMQEDTTHDSHHKRSKAPAVPSVAKELKDTINPDTKERKESERGMPSEMLSKPTVAKKLSSKRRTTSPETIPLQPLGVDIKSDILMATALPIPRVKSVPSTGEDLTAEKKADEKKDDEDSITEEIVDLRTPEVVKPDAESWEDIILENKNKEVSWNEAEKGDKDAIKTRACMLERKSSIGPCFRSARPFGRPSGISVCLSKKSGCNENDDWQQNQSMINITISKKCLVNKTISKTERRTDKNDSNANKTKEHCLATLLQKVANMGDKIKNVFT